MPLLNFNHYLALHEKRVGNLKEEDVTVREVRMENTYDTGIPYYIMKIKESPFPLIFPVDGETRRIQNLRKGDKITIKRCGSKPFKIVEITYKNGEIIFSHKDSIDKYVI